MKKAWINYWVDMVTGGAFLLCAVTGIVFLFFPGLIRTSGGEATILGVSSAAWHWVHDWSGVVMTAGVGVHTALHLRWLVTMTRKLSRDERAAGAPGRSRERARIVSPGAAPVVAAAVAAGAAAPRPSGAQPSAATYAGAQPSPAATLERLRRLSAERPAEAPRYGRRAFLAGAAAVGGAALLAGVGLTSRDGSTTTVTQSNGSGGADGGSPQGYGQGGGSSSSSSGAASGSQDGTTTTSERVAVNSTSCVGCGHCLRACPYGVFDWGGDGRAVASDPDACRLCGRCLQVCPVSAITLNG